MQRIQGHYMSIPGDKVACIILDGGGNKIDWSQDQRLVIENWYSGEGRDRKRNRLASEARISNRQMPVPFEKIENCCVCSFHVKLEMVILS